MIRPDPSRPAPPRLRAGSRMTAIHDRSLTAHCYDAVELQNSSAVSEARATMPEHVPKFRRFEFINIGTPKHRNVGTLQVRLRFFIVRSADNHGVRPKFMGSGLNFGVRASLLRPDPSGQTPGSAQGRARLISGPDLDKGITGLAGILLNRALRRDDAELDWFPPDLNYATHFFAALNFQRYSCARKSGTLSAEGEREKRKRIRD